MKLRRVIRSQARAKREWCADAMPTFTCSENPEAVNLGGKTQEHMDHIFENTCPNSTTVWYKSHRYQRRDQHSTCYGRSRQKVGQVETFTCLVLQQARKDGRSVHLTSSWTSAISDTLSWRNIFKHTTGESCSRETTSETTMNAETSLDTTSRIFRDGWRSQRCGIGSHVGAQRELHKRG